MIRILCLETSTEVCSVALFENDQLVAFRETNEKNAHSARLTLMLQDMLKELQLPFTSVNTVAVSMGPGSYTGLRIGAGVAKGLCYALNIPLIAVSTLEGIALETARQALSIHPINNLTIIPMIDARRMEVYSAVYDAKGVMLRETMAEIIHGDSFKHYHSPVILAGDGATKCRQLFEDNPNVIIMDHILASARWMGNIAYKKFQAGTFENTAFFEPFYLKDFIAGIPKVKGLK